MSEELLPCPFCGSRAALIKDEYGSYNVVCQDPKWLDPTIDDDLACTISGPIRKREADAIAAWNRRVPPVAEARDG